MLLSSLLFLPYTFLPSNSTSHRSHFFFGHLIPSIPLFLSASSLRTFPHATVAVLSQGSTTQDMLCCVHTHTHTHSLSKHGKLSSVSLAAPRPSPVKWDERLEWGARSAMHARQNVYGCFIWWEVGYPFQMRCWFNVLDHFSWAVIIQISHTQGHRLLRFRRARCNICVCVCSLC